MQNANQALQTTLTDYARAIATMYAIARLILTDEWAAFSIDERVDIVDKVVERLKGLQPRVSRIHPSSGLNVLQQAVFLSRAQADAPGVLEFAAAVSAITLRLNHDLISLAQLQSRPMSTGELLGVLHKLEADVRYAVAVESELLRHSLEHSTHLLFQTAYRIAFEAHTLLAVECAIHGPDVEVKPGERMQSRKLFDHAAAILVSSAEILSGELPEPEEIDEPEETDETDNIESHPEQAEAAAEQAEMTTTQDAEPSPEAPERADAPEAEPIEDAAASANATS